jgi:hypothetical protein
MSSTYNPGRVAGLWCLLLIAIGPHQRRQRKKPSTRKDERGVNLIAVQTQKHYGQRVLLRFIEHGQEIGAPRDHPCAKFVHHVYKVGDRRQQTAEDYDEHSEVLIHALKQPIEGQHEEIRTNPPASSAGMPKRKSRS